VPVDLSVFPGGDLVEKGLRDLAHRLQTEESLLVLAAGPRLRRLGFDVPEVIAGEEPYEHMLFTMIEGRKQKGSHSTYNALIQRVSSFADTYTAYIRRHPPEI